jgi:hypothetical protein
MELPAVFIHVQTCQRSVASFTVTHVSGYATTYARHEDAAELTCPEAAMLLGVPPHALEHWAQRLAFPHVAGVGGAARFKRVEIEALRDALASTHSIEGAVRAARDRVEG